MELDDVRRNWEKFGEQDPLWAILTYPSKRNGGWSLEEFFATGRSHVEVLLHELSSAGIDFVPDRCLDFGCGVGRITQAFCSHFQTCDGVDIAAPMISLARQFNRHGQRCRYHLNLADDLNLFPDASFDFVHTAAVLQHMEPKFGEKYIAEFIRLLRPQGVAVFDVPGSYIEDIPLNEGAHQASITLLRQSNEPLIMTPGEKRPLSVRVLNTGNATWEWLGGAWPIHLGNHWLSADGSKMIICDDGRAEIGRNVIPGGQATCEITVTAPNRPGNYMLELDVVEEGITWFAHRGSPTYRIPVKISLPGLTARFRTHNRQPQQRAPEKSAVRSGSPGEIEPAVMEMHCIPEERVKEVVSRAGGHVLYVERSDEGSQGYNCCRYIVARRSHS
jgi:SAM-dependent methyltransferase